MSNHKSSQRFLRNLRLIVKCGICGHRQKLQFHHIKPTKLNGASRGLWRRAKDIKEHPDCYIPLCYFCHQKVTSGIIQIERVVGILMWYTSEENPRKGQYVGDLHVIN